MREFNGENMMGKCKKRIIKGMCLIETVVDRKKVKDGSRKIYLYRGERIKAAMTVRK